MIAQNREIDEYFFTVFNKVVKDWKLGLQESNKVTFVEYLTRLVLNVNPCYIVTEEGAIKMINEINTHPSIKQFLEKVYFIFSSSLSNDSYYELLKRLARGVTLEKTQKNGVSILQKDIIRYPTEEDVYNLLSVSNYLATLLMIIKTINIENVVK